MSLLSGCGGGGSGSGGSSTVTQQSEPVTILTQPSSQTIPIGRTATFTVAATGSDPLQYQWSENGSPITGATSASYTTPAVTAADSNATFAVTVSDSSSSATSATATLTAGPRAPALGDLRYLLYEQVTTAGLYQDPGEATDLNGAGGVQFPNGIGTPLTMGTNFVCYPGVAYDCAWSLSAFDLPAGQSKLSMNYTSDAYSSFASDLQSLAASNLVIDSLDMEPGNGLYAISYVQTSQIGGFDDRLEVVSPDQLQATVANDGAQSRVVTAVSFDANNEANVISYGWTGDTSTAYEAQTAIASSASDIESQARSMAASGYFLSAFGGNDTDGYMLIGMRVQGDTMARPISVTDSSGTSSANTLPQQNPPYETEVIAGGFFGTFTTAGKTIYVWEE